jgi:ankyrin repeat protein
MDNLGLAIIQDGASPLLVASAKGNRQVVEVLVHKGADINLRDKVM